MSWNLPRNPYNLYSLLCAAGIVFFTPLAGIGQEIDVEHLRVRSGFGKCREAFQQGKARVAFLGGSITEMNGYRPLMMAFLQQKFPKCEFDFINAGIASTCSTTGAHRLRSDVLQRGAVDLLFVEFAVNDDQDAAHSTQDCIRGMEGIVRQTRKLNPEAEIVVVYFVNPGMLEQLREEQQKPVGERKLPRSMAAHERVTQHYGVTSVLLGSELAKRVNEKSMTWAEYGGTHPKAAGNRLAADMCIAAIELGWAGNVETTHHGKLPAPIDGHSYDGGVWLAPEANARGKWRVGVPDWQSLPGQFRSRFQGVPALHCDQPGEQTSLTFEGRAIGAFVLAGPDAGQLQVSVDGSDWKTIELFHRFSRGLHYPRTVMFFDELKPGPHRLVVKVSEDKHASSRGHAVRILKFAVNQ